MDTEKVQKTIDTIGLSRKAYREIFQLIQKKFEKAKVRATFLPRPSSVKQCKKKTNQKIFELLGNPYCIRETYISKDSEKVYDEYNNIFFDLVSLQKAMIKFHNLSHEESSRIAQFVIKLDETEIIKCKKLERVSITLMNRALKNPTDT